MPRKTLGQEEFPLKGRRPCNDLDDLSAVIDWSEIAESLHPVSNSRRGQMAWPPLSLFQALLLGVWYDLSDVKLAEALDDRASFRRFCGFSKTEATPERTAFVRFRRHLISLGVSDGIFSLVTAQLKERHITVKTGTLIDATIIDSASKGDGEAKWVKHKGKPARHGYKAHITADKTTALIESLGTTKANVNDGKAGKTIIADNPGDVYADSAYGGSPFKAAVALKGGRARVVVTGVYARTQAEAEERLRKIHGPIHKVRPAIEKIFGTMKRSYGLSRMRWMGLEKAHLQNSLTAVAYNMKRALTLSRQLA